jgi:hypothetical protein
MIFDLILDVMNGFGFSARIGSIVPPLGRGYFPYHPRPFVPGLEF